MNQSKLSKIIEIAPLFLRQGVILVFSLAFSVVLARHGNFEQFAIFSNAIIAMNLLNIMVDSSIYGIAMKYNYNSTQFKSVFSMHVLASFILAVIIFSLSGSIVKILFLKPLVIYAIAASIVILPWQAAMQFKNEKHGQFWSNVLTELTQISIFYAVSVYAILFIDDSSHEYALAAAFLLRSIMGVLLAYLRSKEMPLFLFNRVDTGIFRNSLTIFLINIIGFSNSLAAPLIIGANLSSKSVAIVNWSASNAQYVQQPLLILNRYLFPALSRRRKNEFGDIYIYLAGLYLGILGIFVVFIGYFIKTVFGDKWLSYENVLLLLLMTTLLTPLSVPTGVIANINGKSSIIFNMSLLRIAIFWISLLIFVKIGLGIYSFVYAQGLAELIHIVTFFLINGKAGLKILNKYMVLAVCSCWLIIMAFYLDTLKLDPVKDIVNKITIITIYIYILYFLSGRIVRRLA